MARKRIKEPLSRALSHIRRYTSRRVFKFISIELTKMRSCLMSSIGLWEQRRRHVPTVNAIERGKDVFVTPYWTGRSRTISTEFHWRKLDTHSNGNKQTKASDGPRCRFVLRQMCRSSYARDSHREKHETHPLSAAMCATIWCLSLAFVALGRTWMKIVRNRGAEMRLHFTWQKHYVMNAQRQWSLYVLSQRINS